MIALLATDRSALGQAGSTGGTIGKTDKSLSGGEEQQRPRTIVLYCNKQAPGSMVLTEVLEVDLDRSTVRVLEDATTTKPEPEVAAQISLQWIKWHHGYINEEIDRFSGEYHLFNSMPGMESQGSGDLDLSHWKGLCTMHEGPTIR